MKLRYRLILVFMILTGGGIYYLVDWFIKDLRPRYLEASEESLIDTANLLAEWLGLHWGDSGSDPDRGELETLFARLRSRRLNAYVYGLHKTSVDLRAYVTDTAGKVIFDSDLGRDEGKDYSQWRDVALTLKGEYGARSSLRDPQNPASSELYIAAPIRSQGRLVGVVSVCKPKKSIDFFLGIARGKALWAGLFAALGVGMAGLVLVIWITNPLKALTEYALAMRDGVAIQRPPRLRGEMKALFEAYESLRKALEGRNYVENYVQSLTHALKSPLAAIQGSAELLQEEMPIEARRKFLGNIRAESARMRETVDSMLSLAGLETRRQLETRQAVALNDLVDDIVRGLASLISEKGAEVVVMGEGEVWGDPVLLRTAMMNLIENSLAFAPRGGRIEIALRPGDGEIQVVLEDEGPGVPEYALDRIGERFFSLQRPDGGRKGTGLGISWVREVTRLHRGRLHFQNREKSGLRVTWTLPRGNPSEPS